MLCDGPLLRLPRTLGLARPRGALGGGGAGGAVAAGGGEAGLVVWQATFVWTGRQKKGRKSLSVSQLHFIQFCHSTIQNGFSIQTILDSVPTLRVAFT